MGRIKIMVVNKLCMYVHHNLTEETNKTSHYAYCNVEAFFTLPSRKVANCLSTLQEPVYVWRGIFRGIRHVAK